VDTVAGNRKCLFCKLGVLLEDINGKQYEDRRLHNLQYVCVNWLHVLINHNNAGVQGKLAKLEARC